MTYFYLAEDGPHDVPVVADGVGPFESLAEALATWVGFHEASAEELDAYTAYWDKQYAEQTGDLT